MDAVALATMLKDYGPWGLLALSMLVIKILWDYIQTLHTKIETLNKEWRADSAAQGDKLTSILEQAKGRSR